MASHQRGDGARELTERLARDPEDESAYLALHAHYCAEADQLALANLVAGRAAAERDTQLASNYYKEAGDIADRELDEPKRAESYYRKALECDPRNIDASECLQALLERQGRLSELTELIADLVARLQSDPEQRDVLAILHYRLGELYGKRDARPELALEHYTAAYEADGTLLRAMYEARLLQLARGEVRAACALYEREASADPDVERKVALLGELAGRYSELSDHDGAVSALERARALAPADVALTHALASALVERSKRVDERIRALDLDRVADLLCDIAQSVGPDEGRSFLAAALGHAPWHHRALAEAERTTPVADQDALALHWVAYLTHNPDGDAADERRIRLAGAYRRAGQLTDAIYALTPAAAHGHVQARALLDELQAENAGREPALTPQERDAASASQLQLQPPPSSAARLAAESSLTGTQELSSLSLLEDAEAAEAAAVGDPLASAGSGHAASAVPGGAPAAQSGASSADPPLEGAEPEPRDAAAAAPDADGAGEPEEPEYVDDDASEELARWRAELAAVVRGGLAESGIELAEKILGLAPGDPDAFNVAERHYRKQRDFRGRAQLLLCSARAAELPQATRVQRLREAISLFESRLSDVDGAVSAYRELSAIAPDADDAQRGLIRLLERARRWNMLIEVLEQALLAQTELAPKLVLLRRMTEVHRRERKDSAAAVETLSLLLELDPEDRQARISLCEELLALERWNEAAALIDQRIEDSTSKAEQVPLLRQLGELFETRLADSEAAYHAYERLLARVPNDASALERMQAIAEASGAHERLLATLELRLESATPLQAASLLLRMATLAETELLDAERAASYLQRALAGAPNNAQLVSALMELYERSRQYPQLLALLRERAVVERQGKQRAELQRRIGRLLADQLADHDAAAEAFAKVNEHGDDHEAWSFLAQRARDRGDRLALVQALARLSPLESEPEARRSLLFQRASLLDALGQKAEAIDPLVQLQIEREAADPEARALLERLCAELSDYRGLAKLLEAHLQRAPDAATQAGLACELADLYTERLPDEVRAIRALQLWAKSAPSNAEPFRRLAEHYERRRRPKELLDALDALSNVEATEQARASALERAALLAYARLKDEAGAFARLAQYGGKFPFPFSGELLDLARKLGRVAELCDLCEQERRYDEFFELLRERIAASREPNTTIELYRRLAAGLIEHREDDSGALAAYEGALAISDDNEALRFVQSWAMRHDDPERLAQALLRLSNHEPDPDEKRDLLYERGRLLLTRLARPDQAIAAFDAASAVDPGFAPALDELANACELAGDHPRLAQTLERQLAHPDPGHSQLALIRRLADLYEGPVADDARARATLARWAELDPASPEPLRRLRTRLTRGDAPAELLRTLDALAGRERERGARSEALVAAALLSFERLSDAAGAFARLAPLVPDADPAADAALRRIASGSGRLAELCDLLERAGRHADLVAQLEASANAEPETARAVPLLRRAARVVHAELLDDDRAEALYTRLLGFGEDAEALRFMQARALERDDARELAEVLLRLSRLEREPTELRDLLFEHAHLQNSRLAQPQAAIPCLLRILHELDPEFEPALDELVSAARAADDAAVLADALERQLSREPQPAARAELAQQLAELHELRLSQPAAQRRALEIWASDAPDDVVPRRKLRALLQARGDAVTLLAYLDQIARLTTSRDERRQAERAAALLCSEALNDGAQAFERALRLAHEAAANSGAHTAWAEELLHRFAWQGGKLAELTAYYAEGQRHDELVALLRERAEHETDPAARAELRQEAARTLAIALGDEVGASEVYREVLEVREDAEALEYLREIAERNDAWDELEQLVSRLAALSEAGQARRELLLARARLLGERLERPDQAIALLCGLLDDPEILPPSAAEAAGALVELAAASGDDRALSRGLEMRLALARAPRERHALSLRLADLYDGALADPDRAASALAIACGEDSDDLLSQRRLRAHLERQKAFVELLPVLDALSRIEDSQGARDAARLAAARVLFRQLGDAASALSRLVPLIHAAEPQAVHLADEVCRAGLARELIAVYITRAKQSGGLPLTRASWRKVAEISEAWLNEPEEAFEANLRLLGTDAGNAAYLDEVDRLGKKIGAFKRLQSVYTKLIRETPEPASQLQLHVRLADLLELDAGEPVTALEQLMAASRLDDQDPALLARIERLATQLSSHSELLWAQEQRALRAGHPAAELEAWLEVAQTADAKLRDREAANAALRRALELSDEVPDHQHRLLPLAAALDAARPELGKEDAQRSLLRAHLQLAAGAQPARRTELVLAAFQWLTDTLHDEPGGFDALRLGASEPPVPRVLLETLEAAAVRLGRLDALNAHLARVAERAEPAEERELLGRRARILEERLKRFDQAAQAYERLLELDPLDREVETRHVSCLKKAGRHRELLQALERRAQRAVDPERRIALLREIARIWEVDLKNRASALTTWNELSMLAPDDAEAAEALARLDDGSSARSRVGV